MGPRDSASVQRLSVARSTDSDDKAKCVGNAGLRLRTPISQPQRTSYAHRTIAPSSRARGRPRFLPRGRTSPSCLPGTPVHGCERCSGQRRRRRIERTRRTTDRDRPSSRRGGTDRWRFHLCLPDGRCRSIRAGQERQRRRTRSAAARIAANGPARTVSVRDDPARQLRRQRGTRSLRSEGGWVQGPPA